MKIMSGNSNRPLAEAIAAYLDMPLTRADVKRFADMEVFVEIQENVRGEDVFVVQSTSYPANDNVMELLVTLDALRRGSARRVTAVLPYYGYARQDRKSGPRTPISAKLLANLITTAGADRVLPDGVSLAANTDALTKILQEAGITPAAAGTLDRLPADALSDAAGRMTVLVSCWE